MTIYGDYKEYYAEIGNPYKALEHTKKYYDLLFRKPKKAAGDKIKLVELENDV
ncbi:hypothetical protein [Soonwooa sp.]|uniref:hypothetical protein n=1 Tax=Soonwooa sp. TaxID=1938592 RepID=UPI0035B099E7